MSEREGKYIMLEGCESGEGDFGPNALNKSSISINDISFNALRLRRL
jgi:hypothetical protein